MTENSTLILASSSPRRAKLLRDAGYTFEQVTPLFDDSTVELDLPPTQTAAALAHRKAASVVEQHRGAVIIGCDTLLSVDDRPVGKPRDADDARRIFGTILGRTHDVITAVCLLDTATRRERLFADVAEVTIEPLSPRELDAYIDSAQWRGKAGGYNLAELEGRWRFDVKGDPTTVVGLPMRRLEEELRRFVAQLRPTRAPS